MGVLILVAAWTLYASFPWVLARMGSFLVVDQGPTRSDLIVVLNGRDTERCLAAVDLYRQGYATRIVMARGAKQPGSEEFWRRVGSVLDGKTFFQRSVEAMGVPPEAFQLIGDGITSTYGEAEVVRDFVERNDYRSLLLVTSKWHARRAYWVFESILGKEGVRVTVCPSRYDSFHPEGWWKYEAEREEVFGEYVRLAYYILKMKSIPLVERGGRTGGTPR